MTVVLEQQDGAPEKTTRRSGGREARRAMRAAPLADAVLSVKG